MEIVIYVMENWVRSIVVASMMKSDLKILTSFGDKMGNEIELLQSQLKNTVTLILRLSRRLPADNSVRVQALDYLMREKLMPSILRSDTPEHLRLGSSRPNSIDAAAAIERAENGG